MSIQRIFTVFTILAALVMSFSAARAACRDTKVTTKICVGDHYCAPKAGVQNAGNEWPQWDDNGNPKCRDENTHEVQKVDWVTIACGIADDFEEPPACASDCTSTGVAETEQVTDSRCCSRTFERTCVEEEEETEDTSHSEPISTKPGKR